MDKHQNFAKNLNAIRKAKNESLSEFSSELGIPKSTMQSILASGQTTLDTAMRISEGLAVPLDTLINEEISDKEFKLLQAFIAGLGWFQALDAEDQKTVTFYLAKLLEVFQK